MALYDQEHIRNFYNQYADLETQRWERSIVQKVKFEVHRHYLEKYIQAGDKVLELGAGTGKFTRELAKRCTDLIITDLSPVQLQLNQEYAQKEGYSDKIAQWSLKDICNLEAFEEASFDKILCYGGPLSYVFDQKHQALTEMKRVLKPGGLLLFSVMNLWGTVHQYLEGSLFDTTKEQNDRILATGNLHPSAHAPSDHHCHMFTAGELQTDIAKAGFQCLVLSASNCLSAKNAAVVERQRETPEQWEYFLSMEIAACQSEGMLESGTHLIAVVQKKV